MISASKSGREAVRSVLLARRAELEAVRRMSAEGRKAVTLDQTSVGRLSRMDALQGQAMALASDSRRAEEERRIDAALARLQSGDWGWCVVCGDEIAPQRLELDPTVPTCLDCAGTGTGTAARPRRG